ncbi:MAG: hypothetical protein A3C84_04560 [Candidatus Ryanbacteria bacterium RIFCSPHIGHO2_02_FULL_48_12]|uniref:Uncharacterized protein n=1 Tax=Candidatus Ryanbacteria bacterium RIFCSPHIGHO2_01_FULL_48_27 TaxID=1802115 RepID=A0A1G2G627_9BACT|nr:MAG: hypothetical protein A2756_02240 [Candidatus Ryanbacteria bacterium RIFCSPHIGHO2_01_FULL_48_27]OGZ49851.1 MAG: hypothetical protein A3C84_04560 [Candidatus Ryanbacteria bacterium RIFCSPHIGHO2_02_FULL_48_12]
MALASRDIRDFECDKVVRILQADGGYARIRVQTIDRDLYLCVEPKEGDPGREAAVAFIVEIFEILKKQVFVPVAQGPVNAPVEKISLLRTWLNRDDYPIIRTINAILELDPEPNSELVQAQDSL